MAASREVLMLRIYALLAEVKDETDIETNIRNRGLMGNEKRPAQALLDGDERLVRAYPASRRGRELAAMLPQIMGATPQIFYLPKEKRPLNTEDAKNIGTEASQWLEKVLAKIWNDATLHGLLGPEGSLVYNGCETDLKSGSAMSGEVRLDFTMNYLLQP